MPRIKLFEFVLVLSSLSLFFSCDSKPNDLPDPYRELSLSLISPQLKQLAAHKDDSLAALRNFSAGIAVHHKMFQSDLLELKESLNFREDKMTDEELALLLTKAAVNMKLAVMRKNLFFRDSLRSIIFFSALRQMNVSQYADLQEANAADFLEAYNKYLIRATATKNASLTSTGGLVMFLALPLREPTSYGTNSLETKAFAFIRARILGREFNASLNEKQKLLMKGRSMDFINALSEKQSKHFSDFKKYSDMLD